MNILSFISVALFFTTVLTVERYRRFYINETISTRIMLWCPLAWSDEDSISFKYVKNDITTTMKASENFPNDIFFEEVIPESRSSHYLCEVSHKIDNSSEVANLYIDRVGQYREIQKLKYTTKNTMMKEGKLGDSLVLKCQIEDKSSSNFIWFGPDLFQFNNTKASLEINNLKNNDFGEYFCGRIDDQKDSVLVVGKIVVKLPSTTYDPEIKNAAKLLLTPVYKLGRSITYQPNSAYTLTRRLIWEYPPEMVLLNQGRIFNMPTFSPEMTREEFYYRETDRINPNYISARKVLFQSQKMGKKSFIVDINPSPASVVIGFPIDLFCNNSNDLKAKWFYKNESTSLLQDLPFGVDIRTEGFFTILKINNSEQFHSGVYVCHAKKGFAKVIVEVLPPPKLIVSPTEIVIRPGSSARFLCQLINSVGKVIWRRRDTKSFRMNVESRIGGDTQAILIVEKVPKDLNGSIYECVHNEIVLETLLMVKDLCPDNKRACRNGDCIDEGLFCNGVKDCTDISDEDHVTCAQCEPNQLACMIVDNKKPLQKCVLRHWYCDGDNDCGNGFDELNCPKINKDTCLSTHFSCNDNQTLIPRSLWCDKTPNCPNADDENNCRDVTLILPTKETTYVIQNNTSVSLVCEVVSVPTSTINWRYNWGRLPQKMKFKVTQTGSNCNRIRNTLTIYNMHKDFAGIYTCEAVSLSRAMGKDYTLFVTSEMLCKRPYFNNAAWLKELCLKCFCSDVTDDCTSATGYFQSPTLRVSEYYRGYLMNVVSKRFMETGNSKSLFDKNTKIYRFNNESYAKLVINPFMYLTSSFGLSGSWLKSYSFYMVVTMKLTGPHSEEIPGPAIVIKGANGKSLHWCRSELSQVIYTSETGYVNILKLSLWEKENWYNNLACSASSTREDFLRVLSDVTHILIRIKYYVGQTEFELHNITLEHAIAAAKEETGVLVPKVEVCKCPFPYLGLSCERCAEGYIKDSKGRCIKSCPMNCKKCSENGECITCKGYRSGPQCLQCKSGFTRTIKGNMLENCVECPCGEQFNKTMIGNECGRDLSNEGKIECKCTGREINEPLCDICLRTPLLPKNEKECINRKISENPKCNKHGTEKIIEKNCKCKSAYKGEFCTECDSNHFEYDGKCLKCFCSSATDQCRGSTEYKFVNLSLNSEDYNLNIKLTNRQLSGVYEVEGNVGNPKVHYLNNTIVVNENPNGKGLVYVTIKVEDKKNPDSINTYTMMYGGKIMFKFEYISESPQNLVFNDVTPFLEIESAKLGRIWIPLKYDDQSKLMEAKLSEDSFPSWRFSKDDSSLNRETFIRVLMTAQHLSIGFPFDNDIVKKVRISQLTLEHARKQVEPGMIAPVEVCPCSSDMSGIKCEECNKPGYKSVLTLSPNIPDFTCGKCNSPSCDKCAAGTYKYDFILNKNFSTCQLGIEISSKGRVIRVNRGESLTIPCNAKSHRGGTAIHKWTKQDSQQNLNTFRYLNDDGESTVILHFNEIKLSDAGYYFCHARNAISNDKEAFLVEVIDQPARLKVDIFVTEQMPNVQFNASITTPKAPTDYKIIWSVVKDGKKTPEEAFKVKVSTDKSQYKIDVEITTNLTDGVQLRGLVIGTKVTNPFYYEIRQDIRQNVSIKIDDLKLSTDKNILKLKFLETGVIKVITSPNIRTETFWYKINENGTEVPLPDGITGKGNDLIVWTASEKHNGKYVGYVINTNQGSKYGKVYTEIQVEPMIPNIEREMYNVVKTSNISIHLYVPLTKYCPNQSWEVHNIKSGSIKEITQKVSRVSDKEVIINYPLILGDIVKFRCSVIPDANLTGEIKISLESKFPIIEIAPKFENSSFPVRLECTDKNTALISNITWYFNGKPIGKEGIVDWKILGGFLPHVHEGIYTCNATHLTNTVTKSIRMPETRSALTPGYINIVSVTHHIAKENGTYKIYVAAGQKLQVTVELIGLPPVGTKIEWFINNITLIPTKSGNYFSNVEISSTNLKDHYGVYRVQVVLPNGTVIHKSFEIIPQKKLNYYVKIEGVNMKGDVEILEGDSHMIGCKFFKRKNDKDIEEQNIKTDWKFIDRVGASWNIPNLHGLKGKAELKFIDIIKAQKNLNQYRGQCIVTYNGEAYMSKFFTFDVNQNNIYHKVRIIGLLEDKYIANEEGGTSEITCQAYDERSKRVLPNANYKWVMVFNSRNRKINWNKMDINGDKITFGGLIYHKLNNSAFGTCNVDYFGSRLTSNEFTFKIKKKEIDAKLPKIKIEITYNTQKPPYPVSMECKDLKFNSTANFTLSVSNPNFQRYINTTRQGYLFVNFTSNGTAFNPYEDSGLYKFVVTNQYGYKEKQILLPQYKNPNRDYKANIVIYSTTGTITNGKIRVKANTKLKILCVYYGHPYPSSLGWKSPNIKTSNLDIESSDYWTSINILNFNVEKHNGEYECLGKSHSGDMSEKVTVEGYDFGIKVDIFDEKNKKMIKEKILEQGQTFVIKYKATDLFDNKEVRDLNGMWEYRYSEMDNFTEIKQSTFPKETVNFDGMTMTIKEIIHTGRLEIRCKYQRKGDAYVSESVVLKVNENTDIHPEPHFRIIHANMSIYPTKLQCLDTSSNPSNLTLIKVNGNEIKDLRYVYKRNQILVEWKKYAFSPYYDSGSYQCTAVGRYQNQTIYIELPEENNRLFGTYVKFESRLNLIEFKNKQKSVEIAEGKRVKIICNYYGSRPPLTDVEIVLESNSGETKAASSFATNYSSKSLYSEININKFDISKHTGMYLCRTRNITHSLTDTILIKGVKPGLKVTVGGLDADSNLKVILGSTKRLKCYAVDAISKNLVRNVKFDWKLETLKGEAFDVDDFSETVKKKDGSIIFAVVKPNEGLRGRCEATSKAGSFYSEYFKITVNQDGVNKPKLEFIAVPGNEERGFPQSLRCTDESSNTSDIKITRLSGSPSGVTINNNKDFTELIFPKDIENPLLFDGSYRCDGVNKYGKDWKVIEIKYIRKSKPLIVKISSKDIGIETRMNMKTIDIPVGKRLELDCTYSGDNQPLIANWVLTQGTEKISLELNKPLNGFEVYQKRSDCLSIVQLSFSNKGSISLNCFVRDTISTTKTEAITINVIIVGTKVVISGFDNGTETVLKQGSDKVLSCKVIDLTSDKDISKTYKIMWIFTDDKGQKVETKDLAANVIEENGNLKLESLKKPSKVIMGHCFVNNGTNNNTSPTFKYDVKQDDDKKPNLTLSEVIEKNKKFPDSLKCSDNNDKESKIIVTRADGKLVPKEWIQTHKGYVIINFPTKDLDLKAHEATYICKGINKYGSDETSLSVMIRELLSVTLNSTINKIDSNKYGNLTITIRNSRKLELDCYVTGIPTPKIEFSIITEEYIPDLPVPSQKIRLVPKDVNSAYQVEVITDKHYRLSAQYYSQSPPASFICEATLKNKTAASLVKVEEVKDIFRVNIISYQQHQLNQQAFLDKPFKVGCEMRKLNNELVKMQSIQWKFNTPSGETIDLKKLAKTVIEKDNTLTFDKLSSTYGNSIKGKCIAFYNDTYDTRSEEFSLNIKKSPKIVRVYLELVSPKIEYDVPLNYTYDAKDATDFRCKAITTNDITPSITWVKCLDESCNSKETSGIGSSLMFYANSTKYSDSGEYRCIVNLRMDNKVIAEATGVINIKRKAAPKIFKDSNFESKHSIILTCDNANSSPEGNVTWSFIPLGTDVEKMLPQTSNVKTENQISTLTINKPLKMEYAGTYICKTSNEYGSGGRRFNVKVLSTSRSRLI